MSSHSLVNIKQEYFEMSPTDELTDLKRKYSRVEIENVELKEKINSIEENIIRVNQKFVNDLEYQIKKLENELNKKICDLEKEQKLNKNLTNNLKLKEKKLKTQTQEYSKEKAELLKKIDDLTKSLNSKNARDTLMRKYESLNSVDYSELCDSISVDSDDYKPSKSSFYTETNLTERKRGRKKRITSEDKENMMNNSKKSKSTPIKYSKDDNQSEGHVDNEVEEEEELFKITFNCKIEYLLFGSSIWKSFPPKKFLKHSSFYLKRKDMNDSQRKECDILDNFMETLILKFYKIKTRTKAIFKTATGYSLRRYCYKCHANWILNLNIENGEGELICGNKCEHILAQNEISNK